MKRFLLVGCITLLAACSTTQPEAQFQAVATSGCEVWNSVEQAMVPRISTMSETEYKIYEGAFTELVGGTLTRPAAPRSAESGVCRKAAPPGQEAAFDAVVAAALRRIKPLALKYTGVRY